MMCTRMCKEVMAWTHMAKGGGRIDGIGAGAVAFTELLTRGQPRGVAAIVNLTMHFRVYCGGPTWLPRAPHPREPLNLQRGNLVTSFVFTLSLFLPRFATLV